MKESQLFLTFVKKNFFILLLPALTGLLLSIFVYSIQLPQTKIFQSFKVEYSLENIDTVIALADQAVTELRLQEFDQGFPNTKAVIYKNAPLSVAIEVYADNKDIGFELFLKETEYLRQNFIVSTIHEPRVSAVEPNLLKFLLTGLLLGFLTGLIVSLIKEYLQNY